MNKLKLFNDEVVQVNDETALLKLQGKWAIYNEKNSRSPKYDFDDASKLGKNAIVMTEPDDISLYNGQAELKHKEQCGYRIEGSIFKEIEKLITFDDIKSIKNRNNIPYGKCGISRVNHGKFVAASILLRYNSELIMYNGETGKKLWGTESNINGIGQHSDKYIVVSGSSDGQYWCELINLDGECVHRENVGGLSIQLHNAKKNIFSTHKKVFKIENDEVKMLITAPDRPGCGANYINDNFIMSGENISSMYSNCGSIMKYTNAKVVTETGKQLLNDAAITIVDGQNIIIMSCEGMGNSFGLYNKDTGKIQIVEKVKGLYTTWSKNALKVVFKDGSVKFIEDGNLVEQMSDTVYIKKIANTMLGEDIYITMTKQFVYRICNKYGEVLTKQEYYTLAEITSYCKSLIDFDSSKKPLDCCEIKFRYEDGRIQN